MSFLLVIFISHNYGETLNEPVCDNRATTITYLTTLPPQTLARLLEDIRYIYLKHEQYISGTMANLDAPYIHYVVANLQIDFYHTHPQGYEDIYLLVHSLTRVINKLYLSRIFKGCIKIHKS